MSSYINEKTSVADPVVEIKVEIKRSGGQIETDTICLYGNDNIRVGRDVSHNDYAIENLFVSRNHLEFYSVVFDECSAHYPITYVRDRQSTAGFLVNDRHVGGGGGKAPITPGRILLHGDKVTIQPDVTFEIVQPFTPNLILNSVQAEEVKIFKDQYLVKDLTIGGGASAQVHLALDQKTGEYVACKLYNLEHMREAAVQRLVKEQYVRCQIKHPNLASFRGAYKSRSTLYVFEDLATGGDLFTLMSRCRSPLEEIEVRWLIRQVMTGVAYLHEKGIVHRDLKLENILCAVTPQAAHRIVVTDFGHASLVGDGAPTDVVGTQGWQAPEVIKPRCRTGPPVDVWSIGILAIYLLCGNVRSDQIDLLEVFAETYALSPHHNMKWPMNELKVIFEDVTKIRSGNAVSKSGKDFIRCCLHVKPEKRITAAAALKHPWLCEPPDDLELFRQREKQTTENWQPRTVIQKACEDLGQMAQKACGEEMDHMVSPFFSCKV